MFFKPGFEKRKAIRTLRKVKIAEDDLFLIFSWSTSCDDQTGQQNHSTSPKFQMLMFVRINQPLSGHSTSPGHPNTWGDHSFPVGNSSICTYYFLFTLILLWFYDMFFLHPKIIGPKKIGEERPSSSFFRCFSLFYGSVFHPFPKKMICVAGKIDCQICRRLKTLADSGYHVGYPRGSLFAHLSNDKMMASGMYRLFGGMKCYAIMFFLGGLW